MVKARDITGLKFGRLTAIKLEYVKKDKHGTKHFWLFRCDCGKICIVNKQYATSGHTKSCGCQKQERLKEGTKTTHKLSKSRLYIIYNQMKSRCCRPTDVAYPNYGRRGIKICEEWKNNFKAFYDWAMANGYKDNLTIDRINNNGNYEPSNCRWCNKKEQARNTRHNHYITYRGVTHCVTEWAEIYKIDGKLLGTRLRAGWSFTRAV